MAKQNTSLTALIAVVVLLLIDLILWFLVIARLGPVFAQANVALPFASKMFFSGKIIFGAAAVAAAILIVKENLKNKKITFAVNLVAAGFLILIGIIFIFCLFTPIFINRV
ncbi:MAG: hypothetical protein PHP17_06835 [Candidatus Omnitrophica bacterium]|nr:hypothetical protein [Candidatus Omnitrophota bacterium]